MLRRELAQPRGEPQRADAVDAVVVADVVEYLLRGGGVARGPQLARPHILGDGVVAPRNRRTGPRLGPVDGLEVLDGVAGAAHAQGLAHDRVQVDEQATSQPLVDDVFPHPVPRAQRPEVGAFVGGVVVDVQVGVEGAAGVHVGEEGEQGIPFGEVVSRLSGT